MRKVPLLHLKTSPNPSPCGLLSVIPGVLVRRDRSEASLSFGKGPIAVHRHVYIEDSVTGHPEWQWYFPDAVASEFSRSR